MHTQCHYYEPNAEDFSGCPVTNTGANAITPHCLTCSCFPYSAGAWKADFQPNETVKQLFDWFHPVGRLVLSKRVDRWCQMPYPDHPKGCPNFGQQDRCPPKAPHVSDYFDLSRPLYLVNSEFDLDAHARRMAKEHPHWTARQCRCVLYWQSTSRRHMRERAKAVMTWLGLNAMAEVPEAMGVNVYATARLSGLKLERIRNLSICRHVAMVGTGLSGQMNLFDPRCKSGA